MPSTSSSSFDAKYDSASSTLESINKSEGGRAMILLRQREKLQKNVAAAKQKIDDETKKRSFSGLPSKFGASESEVFEDQFKVETVGLVSVEEFREKRLKIQKLRDEAENASQKAAIADRKTPQANCRTNRAVLSFALEEDEEEGDDCSHEDSNHRRRFTSTLGKDPNAETDFLPDVARDEALEKRRQELVTEFLDKEEKIKKELLEVTYSYWDGSGHRRVVTVEKGFSIGEFLGQCKCDLEKDFPEIRGVSAESLMYIKEDLILPHHVTFHDLIRSKAKGKTGPLFKFNVPDEVQVLRDIRKARDEVEFVFL